MNDSARIVSMSDGEIMAVPLLTGACINCQKSGCAKQGKPFPVANPDGFPVSVGSIVKIRANKASQIIQGFLALFLPLCGSVGGYFAGGFLARSAGSQNVQLFQAVGVLAGLVLLSVIVFAVTAKNRKIRKSEISSVVQ